MKMSTSLGEVEMRADNHQIHEPGRNDHARRIIAHSPKANCGDRQRRNHDERGDSSGLIRV